MVIAVHIPLFHKAFLNFSPLLSPILNDIDKYHGNSLLYRKDKLVLLPVGDKTLTMNKDHIIKNIHDRRLNKYRGSRRLPWNLSEWVLELFNNLGVQCQNEIEIVIDVLVIERMFVVAHEFENVSQIELNIAVKLVYHLQLMYVFVFVYGLLFTAEEDNELHQNLFNFLAQIVDF